MIDRQNDRQHVAWDIETTGFAWEDEITVTGFWFPNGHAELIVNTTGDNIEEHPAEERLEQASGASVSVTVASDELELLEAMHRIVFERFDRQYNRLVAFNAESWKSGFDLPFLRTRCFEHDYIWMLDGIQFADLWEALKKRLNTTHTAYGTSESVNSLTGAHQILFDETTPTTLPSEEKPETPHPWYRTNPYDPFEDSGSAVTCYSNGEYLPILEHNLADVHRTWELGELVREYVSPKDITTKKL